MRKVALHVFAVGLSIVASAPAGAVVDQADEDAPADDAAKLDAARTARAYAVLPFGVSPRVSAESVTGHFWGGYDGGTRAALGEAVVDGRLTRFLALRVGASSPDLWGRSTAILGARLGILRDGAAPFDLGVGVFYQPQSIRGDGLVTAAVSAGKTVGRVSSQATLEYGQDPEGDDGLGGAALGAVMRVGHRVHLGVQGRARFQLWSQDQKFANLERPVMDFAAGPLLAYSLGPLDLMAQAGIAGRMLKAPADALADPTKVQLGPLVMLGLGGSL